MKYRVVAMILALAFSGHVSAQGVSGLGYLQVDDGDVALGAMLGSVGYRFEVSEAISLVPEIRGGIGVRDDSFAGVKFKIKGVVAAALRAELQVSEPVYLFTVASYNRYRIKASAQGASIGVTDEDAGFGGGIGFSIGNGGSFEVGYEDIGGLDVISAGIRFQY